MAITSIFDTAVSGLRVAALRADSAAANIVNADTPDYEATRVAQRTLVSGNPLTGGTVVDAQLIGTEQSPDLAREIVRLIEAESAYYSNAEVFRTAEEISDESLDILA